jgi:hypothetical protein
MGIGEDEEKDIKKFSTENLHDKKLVIEMLKYEDTLLLGGQVKRMYQDPIYNGIGSLFPEHAVNRMVLRKFDFDTSDESVENYRRIFKTYYIAPNNYDRDILQSVVYMRENRCLYYDSKVINVGEKLPDCPVYGVDRRKTSIRKALGKFKYAFVAGFSNS